MQWHRLPRPLQPLLLGVCGALAFILAQGFVKHSGIPLQLPARYALPWILLGVMRSEVSQRVLGGGRLDNRVTLRLSITSILFFFALLQAGMIFMLPVCTALAAMTYVPWSGSRTWIRAAVLSSALHVIAQVEITWGWLPLIMPVPVTHLVLAASLGVALLMMANTGMITRQRELADAALAAEQAARVDDLVWAATHDGLTGLLNRSGLEPALAAACAEVGPGAGIGVVFMDLDGFKAVNDDHGHGAGDELLRAVAGRLSGAVRTGDSLARVGGDEFVALMTALPAQSALEAFGDRAQALIDEPFDLSGVRARISVSVGWSFSDQRGLAVDDLLRTADTAMYEHKRAGRTVRALPARVSHDGLG